MNIAVLVKLVPDSQAVIKIDTDRRSIVSGDLNFVLNPYDEYAVEEALQTKQKFGGEVRVISMGDDTVVKALRTALAMGADNATHIKTTSGFDLLGTAKILANVLREGSYDLILTGKQAIDDEAAAIGPMVAEILEIPHVSAAHSIEIAEDKLTAKRDIEGGAEVFESTIPALITAEKGLNEPRYASLKGIMMAKRKKIDTVQAVPIDPKIEINEMTYPLDRPPGRIVGEGVEAVPELIRLLKEEAKVL